MQPSNAALVGLVKLATAEQPMHVCPKRLQELVDDAARPPAQKLDELIRETVEKDPSAAKQARGGGALFPFPPLLFCPRISRAFLTTCFFLIVTIADGHREATQRIRAER